MTVLNSTLTESGSFSFKGNVVIYDGPMPCQDRWLNLCCEVVTLGLKEKRPCDRWSGNDSSHWDQVCRESGNLGWWKSWLIHEQKASVVVISCHFTQQMQIQKLGVLKSLASIHTFDETLHSIDMIKYTISHQSTTVHPSRLSRFCPSPFSDSWIDSAQKIMVCWVIKAFKVLCCPALNGSW